MFKTGTATDYANLLDLLNTFLTATGSAFGLTYVGTGDGTLTAYSGGATSIAETFTITATSSSSFTVVGSVSGSIGPATVGTPFNHTLIAFLITAGGTAFIVGDVFTLSTAPKWVAHRKTLGARLLATEGNTGAYAVQNLVDGKDESSNRYWSAPFATFPQDVEFEFFEAETIASYQLAAFHGWPNYMPTAWDFDYWTGSAWSTLASESGETGWTDDEVRTYTVGSPVSATKYRLHITDCAAATIQMGIARLRRSDGIDAAFSQTIWKAPGNDGDSEILVGVHAFERQDADYFDWEIAGFDSHVATSRWYAQAGFHGKLYLPLWNDSIPYWFIADGRRVVVIAKLNTQYEIAYLGFIDPYFTPDELPYPLALGGSLAFGITVPAWQSTDFRWSNTSNEHRAPTHSDPLSQSDFITEQRQMRARDWSGAWLGYCATVNDIVASPNPLRHTIWPYCCGLSLLDPNLNDGYTLWPVMLNAGTPNTIGELRGVRCVTGQGVTAETLLDHGCISWIVFHNIYRTDRDDFLAVALD